MPKDFRDGKTFPRSGRHKLGKFYWLARAFDKARASADDTIFDYIYPCPMDQGVFERWGISPADFDRAIRDHRDDEAILAWAQSRVSDDRIERANSWLVKEKLENLERQDREELATPR